MMTKQHHHRPPSPAPKSSRTSTATESRAKNGGSIMDDERRQPIFSLRLISLRSLEGWAYPRS